MQKKGSEFFWLGFSNFFILFVIFLDFCRIKDLKDLTRFYSFLGVWTCFWLTILSKPHEKNWAFFPLSYMQLFLFAKECPW